MTTRTTHNTTQAATIAECHARLVALLDAQVALLGQLDALSQRQTALVDAPDVEPLLGVLGERDEVIDALTVAEREVRSLRGPWEAAHGSLSEQQRAEVPRRLEAVASLASQITARDSADQARLHARLSGVASEIAGVASSRRAVSAYGGAGSPQGPKFQDRQG
jgi:hypothetical protein